jgi:methylmalonyl-CoA/ethylmalonyl-CoA epimerase
MRVRERTDRSISPATPKLATPRPAVTGRVLDHVGVAVPSIAQAVPVWTAILGTAPGPAEIVADQGVEVVFFGDGPGMVELLAPITPDSPVTAFLERQGPGLHHLCYRVESVAAALREMEAQGFEAVDTEPRRGARDHLVAFFHPRSAGGVLIELVQHSAAVPHA